MELQIKPIEFPEVIEFNFLQLKTEITAKVESYKNIVYTEEQINLAKTDLANLRKFTKALSDERIKVKNDCLKAYNPFEEKIKELTAIVNEGISNIDNQVKDYAEQQKSEKLKKIVEYFNSTEHPEWLYLESIFNDKWLNASVTIKKVEEEINARLEQIAKDLEILSVMPDFSFEATEAYKNTLDINKAIAEGKRLAEIAKRKAEEQRKMNEAIEKVATSAKNTAESIANAVASMTDAHLRKGWVSFKALLSTEDALALKDFFNSRNIQFEKI